MHITRRRLLKSMAVASCPTLLTSALQALAAQTVEGYRPDLLPSRKVVWDSQLWMARLGPKYTGNKAHVTFVEFLDTELKKIGLAVEHDSYTFTRWDAKRYALKVIGAQGRPQQVPVASYYPYSGETPPDGVTGELVYGGTTISPKVPDDLVGKILYMDVPVQRMGFRERYRLLGVYEKGTEFPTSRTAPFASTADSTPSLEGFKKAGALGVVFGWTDISDENAADQYYPFGRPLQDLPALWVGRNGGAKLRSLAQTRTKATLVLEAGLFPGTRTDTLIATLPGTSSSDDVLTINSHTDGTNATEENGGLGLLALAKYFAQLPKSSRKRTLVFFFTTGHFARAYVGTNGFLENHPEIVHKAVGALSVEHLGCREWKDDAFMKYRPTGKDELSLVLTNFNRMSDIMLEGVQGTSDRRIAVVKADDYFIGEGRFPARAGIPTIGYIPLPDYLLAAPQDGCIGKLSPSLMYGQIQALAKVVHAMEALPARALKS
jgi:hypothetical protein